MKYGEISPAFWKKSWQILAFPSSSALEMIRVQRRQLVEACLSDEEKKREESDSYERNAVETV